MAILDWFLPKDLEEVVSTYNGKIKVKKFMGRVAVWCGSYEQSGPMVKKVWEKALEKILPPKKVLVLGLGCGSVAEIISSKFPDAKITGVEIDPVMVDIGKKYFSLGTNKNLKIVISDAEKFIRNSKIKFDLVIYDTFIKGKAGRVSWAEVARILIDGNLLLINRLQPRYSKQPSLIGTIPPKHFKKVRDLKLEFNEVTFLQKF